MLGMDGGRRQRTQSQFPRPMATAVATSKIDTVVARRGGGSGGGREEGREGGNGGRRGGAAGGLSCALVQDFATSKRNPDQISRDHWGPQAVRLDCGVVRVFGRLVDACAMWQGPDNEEGEQQEHEAEEELVEGIGNGPTGRQGSGTGCFEFMISTDEDHIRIRICSEKWEPNVALYTLNM